RRPLERPNLVGLERAPRARTKLRIAQRTDAGAHQPHDPMADRLAHPAHLPVAPLVDDDAQDVRLDERDLRRRGAPVVELDALAQLPHRAPRGTALDLGDVLLLDTEGRMGEP